MATNGYAPRFKARYREELVSALQGQLGFSNVNQVPRLEKIVVNMGVGDAIKDGRSHTLGPHLLAKLSRRHALRTGHSDVFETNGHVRTIGGARRVYQRSKRT